MEWGLKTCCMGTIMGSLVKRELIPSMDQFVYPPCPTAASAAALPGLQRGCKGKGHQDLLMALGSFVPDHRVLRVMGNLSLSFPALSLSFPGLSLSFPHMSLSFPGLNLSFPGPNLSFPALSLNFPALSHPQHPS